MTKQEVYIEAFKDALKAFAYWKNGIEYVGTSSVKPLSEVLKNPEKVYGFNKELYDSLDK